ncbi:MAG: AraC family transcriptional regulator [Polyangiales bacterium]
MHNARVVHARNLAPTVNRKAIRAALAAAQAACLDERQLARHVGLDLAQLDDADARFSHDLWVALFREIERATRNPAIGLDVAARLPVGHWDTVDFMIAACPTVGAAIQRIERYFALISSAVEHRTHVTPEHVAIRRVHRPDIERSRAATELSIAMIVRRLRALSSEPWTPLRVDFAHSPSTSIDRYHREFACEVRFDRDADVIVLPREVWTMPTAQPQPELCEVLEQHAKILLERMPHEPESHEARVRAALVAMIHQGVPSLAQIAHKLSISERTLQRRLDERKRPYRTIVDDVRYELAQRYLADPTIALAEVGYLVGFEDPSAFSKAFRRWSGTSPSRHRALTTKQRDDANARRTEPPPRER